MSTVRQVVSRVRSMDKLLSSDASITDRVIAAELKSRAVLFIKQQSDRRRLWQTSTMSDGIYGLLIHGVFSVDTSQRLKEVTLSRYINLLQLGLPKKDTYYWIYDRYLYVSSPYVKVVNIWAYFEEDIPDELLYPECDCATRRKNPCANPLDEEFKCPGYLEEVVVKDTLETLLRTYFRVPVDHTSDNKDDQVNKQ
jgi:hypothetical protein